MMKVIQFFSYVLLFYAPICGVEEAWWASYVSPDVECNYYDVLSLSFQATDKEVLEAYTQKKQALLKALKALPESATAERKKLKEAYQKLDNAFDALRNQESRRSYRAFLRSGMSHWEDYYKVKRLLIPFSMQFLTYAIEDEELSEEQKNIIKNHVAIKARKWLAQHKNESPTFLANFLKGLLTHAEREKYRNKDYSATLKCIVNQPHPQAHTTLFYEAIREHNYKLALVLIAYYEILKISLDVGHKPYENAPTPLTMTYQYWVKTLANKALNPSIKHQRCALYERIIAFLIRQVSKKERMAFLHLSGGEKSPWRKEVKSENKKEVISYIITVIIGVVILICWIKTYFFR